MTPRPKDERPPLGGRPGGLTTAAAAAKLAEVGPNEIAREKAISPFRLLLQQFASPLVWLLLGACAIAGLLGELLDSIAIGTIILINAGVGFFQEYRAERAVLARRAEAVLARAQAAGKRGRAPPRRRGADSRRRCRTCRPAPRQSRR